MMERESLRVHRNHVGEPTNIAVSRVTGEDASIVHRKDDASSRKMWGAQRGRGRIELERTRMCAYQGLACSV